MSTIKVDTITDEAGTGAPDFPNGMTGNGSSLTGLATAAQGALADTALQSSSSLAAANLTGTLPAIDGSALTGIEGVPAGVVIYQAANTAPTGFIKANGASLSTTTYANLFAVIGYTFGGSGGSFNVPDLRGEFLRGWDDSRGVDSGRSFGSSQGSNAGSVTANTTVATDGRLLGANWWRNTGRVSSGLASGVSWSSGTQTFGSGESRPRNIALLACIKY